MFERFLDNYINPENELFGYTCKRAISGLEMQEREKDALNDSSTWEKKAEEIRKNFVKSIGGLDFEEVPLNPKLIGELDKGEYIIRKIIFQSLRDFYVTANLYVPKSIIKPVPGILFSCGHSKAAKAEPRYQLAAIELAVNGMAVLVVDPPGQGEIIQMPDRHDIEWGVYEHSYIGLACSLAGMNIARYFIWNLIKAVDLLCSFDFVDEDMIGACGNSGGGTQTSYISLVDDRIKAAAPGCYINGRKQYIPRGHAHDSEQNIYNCMNFGLDYGDFINCFAPKPFRLLSQQYDFFPIEGTLYSLGRARRIYGLYGASENVDITIDENMHGLSDKLRKGLVGFFCETFLDRRPVEVNPFPYLETEENLNCTSNGSILGETEGAVSLDKLVYKDHLETKARDGVIAERLNQVFNIWGDFKRPLEKRINPFEYKGHEAEKVFWMNRIGITNAGIYIKGKEGKRTEYILFENGTNDIERHESHILESLGKGDVFVVDVSGVGSVRPAPINNAHFYDMYGTMHKICNDLMMSGTSLMEIWINDILESLLLSDNEVSISAYGKMGPAAAIAAFGSDRIVSYEEYGKPVDYGNILECRAGFVPELEVFGFSKYLDMIEIYDALGSMGKMQ